jgi:hypothetical protein
LGSCWVVEFVCVFKFVGYIDWLQSCSFCACFFVACLLAFFPFAISASFAGF